MISTAVAGTIALIAVATVVGAMGGRRSGQATPVAATYAVGLILLAVVVLDLVPDVVADLTEAGLPWQPAALAGAFGCVASGQVARWGCLCEPGPRSNRSAVLIGLAITVHRAVEGSAL